MVFKVILQQSKTYKTKTVKIAAKNEIEARQELKRSYSNYNVKAINIY